MEGSQGEDAEVRMKKDKSFWRKKSYFLTPYKMIVLSIV